MTQAVPPGVAPPAEKLAVKFADGTVGRLPAEAAQAAVAAGHAKPATSEEFDQAHAQYQQEHATVADQFVGSTFGAVRGLGSTLGLPVDKAAIDTARFLGGEGAADTTRSVIQNVQNKAPIASKVGEFAGVVAPALLGDEGGLLGATGEAGEGIGAAMARRFAPAAGEEAGLLSRVATKAITSGSRNAAEAAQLGMVDAENESSIENKPLTGEQLFASGLSSAAGGAVFGGLLGAGGELAGSGASKIREAIGGVSVDAPSSLSGHLTNAAEDQYLESLNVTQNVKAARQLKDLPGGRRAAARMAIDDGLTASPTESIQEHAAKLSDALDETNKKIGGIVDKVQEDTGDKLGPDPVQIIKRLDSQLKEPFLKTKSLHGAEIAHVDNIITALIDLPSARMGEDAAAGQRMNFRDLFELRQKIGQKITDAGSLGPGAKESSESKLYNKAYGILDGELESALDNAGDEMGNRAGTEFRAAKLKSRQLRALSNAAKTSAEKAETRQAVSLGTKVLAGGALAAGHPGGMAVAVAHHYAQKYGNRVASHFLDKAARMAAMQRASSSVADEVTTGLQKFFAGEIKVEAIPKLTPAQLDNIQAHLSDPAAQAAGLQQHLGNLPNHAPQIAAQVAATHSRAVSYLSANVPKPLAVSNSMQPQLAKKRYAPQDLTRFARIHQVVANPAIVPQLLGTGQLTHDHVTALKEVYPAIYQEIQNLVQQKVSTSKKAYSYSQRCALSLLFDEPLDATMNPAFIQDVQASYAANPEPPSPGAKAPKRPLKLTGASVSGSEG